jgi:hypothetical protein
MKPIIKYGVPIVCLLVSAFGLLLFLFRPPKGYIYYFPENYAGWICVEHGASGFAPLPEQDGYLIVKVPLSGILRTSSPLRTSPTRDQYYYYDGIKIKDAKGLEFGGGGTFQNRVGETQIMSKFWISNNVKRDYDLYIKGKGIDFENIPCGPFVSNLNKIR